MRPTPPKSLDQLTADLGIKPGQLERLRVKYKTHEALIATLQQWWTETREQPRLLAKSTGYVHERFYALGGQITEEGFEDEPEAVDELTQARITAEARLGRRQESANLIAAAEEVMKAIDDRCENHPEFKRAARLTRHRIRRELDRFIERERRKAA